MEDGLLFESIMKKKYIGLIIDINGLRHYIHANELLMKKISYNFDEFFIINISKLKLKIFAKTFLSWDTFSYKDHEIESVLRNLPKNFTLINPNSFKELNNFLQNKEFLLINSIGKTFSELILHFYLSLKKIKQIIVSNIANNESDLKVSSKQARLKIFLGKRLPEKIISFFMLIGILKKFEVRFESNQKMINFFNKKKKTSLIYKKIIPVNNRSFDNHKLSNLQKTENLIVLIDGNFNHKEDVVVRGHINEELLEEHYKKLNNFLYKMQDLYNKKVVVCIHPQYDLTETKKKFPNFEILKFKTKECIYKAFLVIFFDSTAIFDAFLLRKNIISLKTKLDWLTNTERYSREYGTVLVDLYSEFNFSKKELDEKFSQSKKLYNKFLNDYIIVDGDKIGTDKVINYCQDFIY